MTNGIIDRLSAANPHPPVHDIPPLSDEDIDGIVAAARSRVTGPLARSGLVAAVVGLALGIGIVIVSISGGEGGDVATPPGDTPRTTTSASETPATTVEEARPTISPTTREPGPVELIAPLSIECSTQLNETTFACANLINGTPNYWNDASLRGVGAVITVTFGQPIALEQIQFINAESDVVFRRNYRVRGVEIVADDLPGLPEIAEVPNNNARPHVVAMQTLGTQQLVIRITATWPAEAIDGLAFAELALDEIEFWGRAASDAEGRRRGMPFHLGYRAIIGVESETEACIMIVEEAAGQNDSPCTLQPSAEFTVMTYRGFSNQSHAALAGFVPLGGRVEVHLNGVVYTPIQDRNVWLLVVDDPDLATQLESNGEVVLYVLDEQLERIAVVPPG